MAVNGTGVDPEKLFLIRAADAQAVINNLAKQPCGEVYALVTALLNLQAAPIPAAAPAPLAEP